MKIKSFLFRLITLALCVSVLACVCAIKPDALDYKGSESYTSGKYYDALIKVELTGNQRTDIVNVAKSQIGYQESGRATQLSGTVRGSNNFTEYGYRYGLQDMWCAMFVSWCAGVAGISTSIVPNHAYTPTGLSWFINRGQAYTRVIVEAGGYVPKAGDIIYFKSARNSATTNHIGIVTGYSDGKVYTIEGNTSSETISTDGGAVAAKSYDISNTYIVYICCPAYSSDEGVTSMNIETLCFDAAIYGEKYQDLKDSFGGDESALYKHWIEYGIKEGRCASLILDLKYYVENNEDIKERYGTDYAGAYEHFITEGYKENRKSSPVYDSGYYRAHYPGLEDLDGLDLAIQFCSSGAKAGERASAEFDIGFYKKAYPSVATACGRNNLNICRHYLATGIGQGLKGVDTEAPVISNIEISGISEKGYSISCKVSDNYKISRIEFYAAVNCGRVVRFNGSLRGANASCEIKTSDFGGAAGTYITYIRLYDLEGNEAGEKALTFIKSGRSASTFAEYPLSMLAISRYVGIKGIFLGELHKYAAEYLA